MLYPLSYEGLPVHLPSVWVLFGPLGSGWLPLSDGLCRICAACRVASLCLPSQHPRQLCGW
jgi:hypothetical protein